MDRLRALFLQEAVRRVSALTEGLLAVEGGVADAGVVEQVLRDAHSLKGSAGMVGLAPIGDVAHRLESRVEALRDGAVPATAELVDPMLADVDEIQQMVEAALAELDGGAPAAEAVDPATAPAIAAPPTRAEPQRDPLPTGAPPSSQVPSRSGGAPSAAEPPPTSTSPAAPSAADDGTDPRVPVRLERLDEVVRLAGVVRAGLARLDLDAGSLPAELADVLRDVQRHARQLQREVARARTVPVADVLTKLRRAARDAARARGVQVAVALRGGGVEVDRVVLDAVEDALLHMVRNAVAHGIEPTADRLAAGKDPVGRIVLTATTAGGRIRLALADDGRGLDREALLRRAEADGVPVPEGDGWTDLIFRSGVSTAAGVDRIAGRGVGMDVVASAVRGVRGTTAVTTEAGRGTTIVLDLPITLAVTRCIEVRVGTGRYALPLTAVEAVLTGREDGRGADEDGRGDVPHDGAAPVVERAGGHLVVRHRDVAAPLLDLAALVGRPSRPDGPLVVLAARGTRVALRVGEVVRQAEVTVESRTAGMPVNDLLLGTGIAGDGSALVVLDPAGLVGLVEGDALPPGSSAGHAAADPAASTAAGPTAEGAGAVERRHVLVVDDALAVRELQRTVLERAGYAVSTAADGREALTLLGREPIDLVMTDVEMPRMDGFALTEAIRQDAAIATTPVIVLTTLGDDASRRRGMEAGADGYLVKRDFTAEGLLAAVRGQIGPGVVGA